MKTKSIFLGLFAFILFGIFACSPKVKTTTAKTPTKAPDGMAVAMNNAEKTAIDEKAEFEKTLLNKKLPLDPSIRKGILGNGMQYFIKKNSKPENRVELRLAVKAGSIQEDEDQLGLAHFNEHMEFNGTEHFKANELINYLEKVGTRFGPDLNAYTSFDKTVYMLQVRTDVTNQLDTGLLVLSDWAGRALFDHKEIDKERGVVISEWRSGLSPGQRMMQQYLPVMYKGSRYAKRLPIGDPDIVKNSDYETIKRFYKEWYRPNLMAVIVIGDVDVDQMENKIKKMFSAHTNPKVYRERKEYSVPPQQGTAVSIVTDKEAPYTTVQILNKLPHLPLKTKADYLGNISRRLFNMMLNARLDEIKNTANPPLTFAYSGYSSDVGDIDMFRSWAMVPEGRALEALKTFAEENEKVLRFGFNATELEREKTNLMKSAERALKEKDKTESRRYASKAVYYFLEGAPMMNEEQYYNFLKFNIDKINLLSVNTLAKDWIKEDNRVVIITGPEKEGAVMPTEAEVMAVLKKSKTQELEAYVDDTSDKPLFDKELAPAPIKASEQFSAYGIKRITLANGLDVYFKQTDFKNDEVRFSAYSPGGTSVYNDSDYQQARFASNAIEEMGLAEFDNNQLKKLLTGKNVSVSPGIGTLYDYFRGNSSVEDMETMFQLINLYFTSPRKDQTSFESFVNRNKGLYANLLKQPDYFFYDVKNKVKYGDNPRAGSFPKSEDFANLNLDKVYEIYQDRFSDAGDFKFFFVGNFDEAKFVYFLRKYLGNLPATNRNEKWVDRNVNMREGAIKEKVYNGEAPKTYVDITYHGDFDWSADNQYVLNSMAKVLSIKLRESLREDKGGVYGVGVRGSGYNEPKKLYNVNISFNSDPEKTDELLKATIDVINKLKTEGPDAEVMTKIKETQKQSKIKNLKENRYWLSKMSDMVQDNLDFSEITLETLEKRINKLTAEDIKKAANKYLNDGNRIEILMYPEEYKNK